MLRGLTASIALHAAVIGAGYIALPYVETEVEQVEAVPVQIVAIADVIDIAPIPRRREEEPEPEVQPAPPEVPPVEEFLESLPDETMPDPEVDPDPTPPPPPPPDDPPPEPVIAPNPEIEDDPEPTPEDDEPEPKPDPPEDDPNVVTPPEDEDPLAFLGDDNPFKDLQRDDPPPAPARPREIEEPPAPSPEPPRRGAGEQQRAVATVEAILVSRMKECWEDVVDLPNPNRLLVVVRVRLDENGRLQEEPELVRPRPGQMIGDRPMQVAAERAIIATQRCERDGYNLPDEYYDIWREITFTVGPD